MKKSCVLWDGASYGPGNAVYIDTHARTHTRTHTGCQKMYTHFT